MAEFCVHVVDDDDDMREALSNLLKALGYTVQSHRSAGEFLFSASPGNVGCVLLDVDMPGQSGLDLQRVLIEKGQQQVPIVFLSGKSDISMCAQAFKAGAVDFLTKPFGREALQAAIDAAVARSEQHRAHDRQADTLRRRYESLSDKERAVTEHVMLGRLNKQIASEFGVSERTIKHYRAHVMEKMQVKSLPQLVQAMVSMHGARNGATEGLG